MDVAVKPWGKDPVCLRPLIEPERSLGLHLWGSAFIVQGMKARISALLLTMLAFSAQAEPARELPVEQPGFVQSTRNQVSALMDKGFSFMGIKYRMGGTSPDSGFDCSGLVQRVFGDALGLNLPRTAAEMAKLGNKVGKEELKPGDLVFFKTMRRTFSHVGIYVGDNRFMHAPSKGGVVRVEAIDTSYWNKRFNGARRLLPETGTENPNNAVQPPLRLDMGTLESGSR